MCQEIPADLSVAAKGEQRQSGALDRTERDDDLGVWRHGQRPSLGDDLAYALATHVVNGVQPDNMTARHDHQPLFHVIETGLAGRLTCRFHEQRDGAEFVKGEEAGVPHLSLHGEWCFEFRFISEFLEGGGGLGN